MPEIRAFLAIDIDDDLKPKINKVIKEFKQIDANIRYVDLANLHLTLKFFGDIDIDGIDLLSQKISGVVSEFDSFKIKIILSFFSNHRSVALEVNYKKRTGKFTAIWRLKKHAVEQSKSQLRNQKRN